MLIILMIIIAFHSDLALSVAPYEGKEDVCATKGDCPNNLQPNYDSDYDNECPKNGFWLRNRNICYWSTEQILTTLNATVACRNDVSRAKLAMIEDQATYDVVYAHFQRQLRLQGLEERLYRIGRVYDNEGKVTRFEDGQPALWWRWSPHYPWDEDDSPSVVWDIRARDNHYEQGFRNIPHQWEHLAICQH